MTNHFMFNPKGSKKTGPEANNQKNIIKKLTLLGWYCISTHGSIFQQGLPDVYATHYTYRARWIEVKTRDAYSFTAAQREVFPKLSANGSGIWILFDDTEEELKKLFGPENWYHYMCGLIR